MAVDIPKPKKRVRKGWRNGVKPSLSDIKCTQYPNGQWVVTTEAGAEIVRFNTREEAERAGTPKEAFQP